MSETPEPKPTPGWRRHLKTVVLVGAAVAPAGIVLFGVPYVIIRRREKARESSD